MFTVEEDGVVVATRRQVPLDLVYALTIHRSQGMGFDFVEVHVDKVFEPGQSYVALSRARTVEGLRVVGHIKNLPQISPLVENFYKNKVVSVQGINLDAVDIQPKRREVYVMPVLQVDKASPVPSGIPEPEEIILTQDYQEKAVPEVALKEIITRIKKECEISKDCDDVASELVNADVASELVNAYQFREVCYSSLPGCGVCLVRSVKINLMEKLLELSRGRNGQAIPKIFMRCTVRSSC